MAQKCLTAMKCRINYRSEFSSEFSICDFTFSYNCQIQEDFFSTPFRIETECDVLWFVDITPSLKIIHLAIISTTADITRGHELIPLRPTLVNGGYFAQSLNLFVLRGKLCCLVIVHGTNCTYMYITLNGQYGHFI